jgi:GNAT superfamily N-acetyltransferase
LRETGRAVRVDGGRSVQSGVEFRIVGLQGGDSQLLRELDRLHRLFLQGSRVPTEQFMEFVTGRLGDEGMLVLLAVNGGKAVGYGLAFDVLEHPFMPEWRRCGYITQLYVAPESRRQGVGRALVERTIEWLASRGVDEVMLNVVAGEGTAERFWRAQGFERCRIRMKREV